MTLPEFILVFVWFAVTAYALTAGADFGAGIWDLLSGGAERGAEKRALIERVIAPIWEANHVWLIFIVVVVWTGFPRAFSSVGSTMYIPLTAAAIGIIIRGSGFAFRSAVSELPLRRLFGIGFAGASLLTPFFLGTVAGGIASGRVPVGNAAGDPIGAWVNPTSMLAGALAVMTSAFLSATFLTFDATREGEAGLADAFRVRAIGAGSLAGVTALAGIVVVHRDAPVLFDGLTGRALPLIAMSAAGGVATIVLLWLRRPIPARATAGLAVAAVLWGWAAGQYPYLLVDSLTIAGGAGARATMQALAVSLSIGVVIVVPSLAWLYSLFQRDGSAR